MAAGYFLGTSQTPSEQMTCKVSPSAAGSLAGAHQVHCSSPELMLEVRVTPGSILSVGGTRNVTFDHVSDRAEAQQ